MNISTRRIVILGVIILVFLAGCSGSPPIADTTVEITDSVDRDCDTKYSSVQVSLDVLWYDSSREKIGEDGQIVVSYRDSDGDFKELITYDSLSGDSFTREITVTADDIGLLSDEIENTVIRAQLGRSTFTGTETISVGETRQFSLEAADNDKADLNPSFTQHPAEPNRSEPITLVASSGGSDCSIQSYEWDLDADGVYEEFGSETTVVYSQDGRYEVSLRIEDAGGNTETITKEVVVIHDPDDDGLTTVREEKIGTDPYEYDTDGDLLNDGVDPAPTFWLIPTGLIHLILSISLYLAVFQYHDWIYDKLRPFMPDL